MIYEKPIILVNKMIQKKCNHEWKETTPSSYKENIGWTPAWYMCKKCKTHMTSVEVFQLEALENQNKTLKHLKGFQKYIAIVAVVISFIALFISIYFKCTN